MLGMQREPGSSPSLVEQSRVEPVRLLRTREDGRERVREEARKAGRVERAEPASERSYSVQTHCINTFLRRCSDVLTPVSGGVHTLS